MFLKRLCAAHGISGNEQEVRALIKEELKDFDAHEDVLGNLIVKTNGNGKRIMLAAHMDEVGLIITKIEDNGFLRFKSVGGINTEVIIGKKVLIGKNRVPGIIGVKAVHLQKEENAAPRESELYIDIGAVDKSDAESAVSIADYVAFDERFTVFGDNLWSAKALDDRAGCALICNILKKFKNKNICAAFTVAEEIGTRGAAAAAEEICPDFAVVVEATICNEGYGVPPEKEITRLGAGPALTFMDRSVSADKGIIDSLKKVAESNDIPYQMKRTTAGGTDAGKISRASDGIPTAIIALPCRNLHSPACIISRDDFENAERLLTAFIGEI